MDGGRNLRRTADIARVVAAADATDPGPAMCVACSEGLDVSGAGLLIMDGAMPAPLAWSDPVAQRVAELQCALGEGPGPDAHATGVAITEPDLRSPARVRWAAFGPAALAAGAVAVFAYPLRIGGVRLGALTLHRAGPGGLSPERAADAQAMADAMGLAILAMQSRAAPGSLGRDLERLAAHGAQIHQASGMVSVQLGVSVAEALARLRGHAFATGRPLADVAADIVERRFRLDR